MRLFLNRQGQAWVRLAQVGAVLGVSALIAACGNNYRPVVTPVSTSGPAAQPVAWLVAISQPSPTSAGEATLIDYAGDSVLVEVPIGLAPTTMTLDSSGVTGYTINSDGTITSIPLSTTLQQKQLVTSTLPPAAKPLNMFATFAYLLITDFNGNALDVYAGSPQSYKLSIPVAPSPVLTAGSSSGTSSRVYVVSQNFTDSTGVVCNNSPQSAPASGIATPIELSNDTADPTIPVGKCPVYAVQTPDQRRLFVLNRGDDTITVINTANNALDACTPFVNQNGQTVNCHPTLPLSTLSLTPSNAPANCNIATNPACGMGSVAGPVYAEYNQATSQLVVSNFAGNTISVIDVSTDEYGNDSSTFGTTYTIPVGNNPASVTVLYDGTRAYTANQTDGTVTIVNLSSHTVEKTLAVEGHPRTVVSVENSEYGKVYTASPDSQFITIIETETDLIDTTVLVEGNVVDVRTTNQNGASGGNLNYTSRIPGYGQPCNLPLTSYPSGYTLAQCQAIP